MNISWRLHAPNTVVCAHVHYSTCAAGLVRILPLKVEVALMSTSPLSLNFPQYPNDSSVKELVLMSKCACMCIYMYWLWMDVAHNFVLCFRFEKTPLPPPAVH